MTKVQALIFIFLGPLLAIAELTNTAEQVGAMIAMKNPTDLPSQTFPTKADCKKSGNPNPWADLTVKQRAARIINNVQAVNLQHNIKMDVRFMLCRADHESTMNPLERNCGSTAAGFFGVTSSTTKDMFANTDWESKIPGFAGLDGADFHEKMPTSSYAQTEMSIGVCIEKARTVKKSSIIDNGIESVEGYGEIARAYYGLYKKKKHPKEWEESIKYKNKAMDCYKCMIEKYNFDGTVKNDSKKCFKEEKV